jgi:hypothetical protein
MNVNALYGGGSAQTWANTLAARITVICSMFSLC